MESLKEKLADLIKSYEGNSANNSLINQLKLLIKKSDEDIDFSYSIDSVYKNIINNLQEAVLITDLTDKILFANKTALDKYGYKKEELLGKIANELLVLSINKEEVLKDRLEKRLQGKSESYEALQKTKNGSTWWSHVIGVPYKNASGKIVGTIALIKDISEIRDKEGSIEEISERYEDLFENINDGLAILDANGTIVKTNKAAKKILDLKEDSVISLKEIVHPNDREKSAKYIQQLIDQGSYEKYIGRIISPLGSVKWLEVSSTAVYNENDQFIGSRDIFRDVTKRIELDEQLKNSLKFEAISNYFFQDNIQLKSEEDLVWDAVNSCEKILNIDDCIIYLFDEKEQLLFQKAAIGQKKIEGKQAVLDPIKLKLGEGIVGSAALQQKTLIVDDVKGDDRYVLDYDIGGSEISVPIIYEKKLLGVIDSENSQSGFYNDFHKKILESMASILAIKLSEVKGLRQIEESRAQLSMALEVGSLGMWDWDIINNLEIYSPQWASILGYDLKEIEKEGITFNDLLHPEDLSYSQLHISEHLEGKRDEINQEIRMLAKKWHL